MHACCAHWHVHSAQTKNLLCAAAAACTCMCKRHRIISPAAAQWPHFLWPLLPQPPCSVPHALMPSHAGRHSGTPTDAPPPPGLTAAPGAGRPAAHVMSTASRQHSCTRGDSSGSISTVNPTLTAAGAVMHQDMSKPQCCRGLQQCGAQHIHTSSSLMPLLCCHPVLHHTQQTLLQGTHCRNHTTQSPSPLSSTFSCAAASCARLSASASSRSCLSAAAALCCVRSEASSPSRDCTLPCALPSL